MSYRTSFAVLLVILGGLGCGGRTIGGAGNNNVPGPDAGALPDGTVPFPDGGPGGCTEERYQWLRPWRVDSLYLLQDDPVFEGQTVRIAVGLQFGGCQRLAEVDYEVDHASRTIRLVGYVWEELGESVSCPDVEIYGEEIITVPNPAAGDWRVMEATSGVPGMETWFRVEVCALDVDCFCDYPDPDPPGWYGDPCTFNCDCDPSLQCLEHWGMGGPFSFCGRSCSVDADCQTFERCLFTDDGPWGVCDQELQGLDLCPAQGCPPGFDCTMSFDGSRDCVATFSTAFEGQACDCDEQCPVGLRCIDFGTDAVPSCHAICRGDQDCPGGMCGDDLPDTPPLCMTMWM